MLTMVKLLYIGDDQNDDDDGGGEYNDDYSYPGQVSRGTTGRHTTLVEWAECRTHAMYYSSLFSLVGSMRVCSTTLTTPFRDSCRKRRYCGMEGPKKAKRRTMRYAEQQTRHREWSPPSDMVVEQVGNFNPVGPITALLIIMLLWWLLRNGGKADPSYH